MPFLTAILISSAFVCVGVIFMTILAKVPDPKISNSALFLSVFGFFFIFAGFAFAIITAIKFFKDVGFLS